MTDDPKSSNAVPRITHETVEREAQQAFSPKELLGQDYIWDSVFRPLNRQLSVLCLLEKPVRKAALKYPNDLREFSREVDRMMMALSQLEEEGTFRKLEMRAFKGNWQQEKFDRILARLVIGRATKLTLPDSTTASNVVTIPYGLSQRARKGTISMFGLFKQMVVGSSPTMEAKDFMVLLADLNSSRPGPEPKTDFAKNVRSLDRTAHEQGRSLTDGEMAIELLGVNYGEWAVKLCGEGYLDADEGAKKRAVRDRIREIRRSN